MEESEALIFTEAVTAGATLTITGLEVAGEPVTPIALEVITQVTVSVPVKPEVI